MMVKNVKSFTGAIWGVRRCLNMCVSVQGFIQYFELWVVGWGMLPQIFLYFKIDALRLILRHSAFWGY